MERCGYGCRRRLCSSTDGVRVGVAPIRSVDGALALLSIIADIGQPAIICCRVDGRRHAVVLWSERRLLGQTDFLGRVVRVCARLSLG